MNSNGGGPALRVRWLPVAIALLLAAAVWIVFGQTLRHEFINYDDDVYVYDNPSVIRGLTPGGFAAAFAQTDVGLWTPLTRLSHMIDCQIFGLWPGGHHLTSVLLHTATSILLFAALRRMTGALWRSAFVAAVFAIHPLRVESVAWVSERKDTLSALFFMLTLLAYTGYVARRSRIRYATVIVLFALGLLAKPMLVTLPFVLLLLDYWPLRRTADYRLRLRDWQPLIIEKLPLFALTGISLWVILFDPFGFRDPARASLEPSLSLRISNAAVSYVNYIGQMFWPTNLSVRYPYPIDGLPPLRVIGAIALLGAISAAVYYCRTRRPYLLVGWLWYLGMLVPVSQVVLLGTEARCDRYTYLPQIGLYIFLAWGVNDLLQRWRYRRVLLAAAAALIIATLMALSYVQTSYWRNSLALWRQAVASAPPDWMTHNTLGLALWNSDNLSDEALHHFQQAVRLKPDSVHANNGLGLSLAAHGKLDEAVRCYERALQISPTYAFAENNLGTALAKLGKLPEAMRHLERALHLKPYYPEAHDNVGLVLAMQGKLDEAVHHHRLALADKPEFAAAHNNLGTALAAQGKVAEALQSYERALQLRPGYAAAHLNLGMLLAGQGKVEDAITHYNAVLQLEPAAPGAYNNLAWLLATSPAPSVRNGARAVELAREAARLTREDDAAVLDTLAAAYAEAGEYNDAVSVITRAIQLAGSAQNNDLAAQLESRRQIYLRAEPYRDRG